MSTLRSIGEFGLIREISKWVPCAQGIVQGIGDDTAVFRVRAGRYQLLTIDTLVEGIDFRKDEATPQEIGRKALAVNLSDIAAMGGIPKVAVISLTLPRETPLRFVKKFYEGVRRLAKRFNVSIVGGDLSRGSKVSSSVAVLGEADRKRTVFRKGAKIGDWVCVTGRLGGSIRGKHLHFTPRIHEGQFLARQGVSAMIDLSDGLWQDINQLAYSSRVAFKIDDQKIPVASAARRDAHGNMKKALQHALYDGEDFELLFTIAPARFQKAKKAWARRFSIPLTAIGQVIQGPKRTPVFRKRLGFQHF